MNQLPQQFVITQLRTVLQELQRGLAEARYRQKISLADIEQYENKIKVTEDAIRQLENEIVSLPPYEVRPGEFSRMTLLPALISYLEKRGGVAKLRAECVPALTIGGAITNKTGKPLSDVSEEARYRILKGIVERHSRGLLEYDEATDTVRIKQRG